MEDIRYKQRFENFEKSFLLLKKSLEIVNPSIVEKAGVIQFFETSFELSWKLMKDYAMYLGYEVKSPREAIKRAFNIEIITEGSNWLNALVDRNLTVHTYDEEIANEVYEKIKEEYFYLIEELYNNFKDDKCLD